MPYHSRYRKKNEENQSNMVPNAEISPISRTDPLDMLGRSMNNRLG
jgi:hypothetical protein